MTDRYLTTVLEEAERVAEHHDQVVRSPENPSHEYLQYAVLRLLEGEADETAVEVPQVEGVTVSYGEDKAMCESWGDDVEWWETVSPQAECTRFRVFYPGEYEAVLLSSSMYWLHAVCGAFGPGALPPVAHTGIASGTKCTTWAGRHPVEDLLENRIQGFTAAVAPDGGRTGDVRDRMVVTEHSTQHDDLEPRTRHAVDEEMAVSLLEKGGRYEVRSPSGNWYEVDVISESCTCLDWQKHTPEGGCKYLRRVDHEIK